MNKLVFLHIVLIISVASSSAAENSESINLANKVVKVNTKNAQYRIEIPDLLNPENNDNLKAKNSRVDASSAKKSSSNLPKQVKTATTTTKQSTTTTKDKRVFYATRKNSQNLANIVKLSKEEAMSRLSAILHSRLEQKNLLLRPIEEPFKSTQLRNKFREFRMRQRPRSSFRPHRPLLF